MTRLILPAIPRTDMYINNVMAREWQDFFRDLMNLLGGDIGSLRDLWSAVAAGVYDVPVNYGKDIEEIKRKLETIPSGKNYAKDIDRLELLIVSNALTPSQDEEMEKIYTSIGKNKIQKDLTFSNDTGTVSLFTVTGDVFVGLIPVITTDVTSALSADISLGVVGNTNAMIVNSLSTGLDARGIWVDQTPDNEIEPLDRIRSYIITDGNDIILTLSAQVDAGAISFYCFWTPLSADGLVEAA